MRAVVTGAASGIGLATAQLLAKAPGAAVLLVDRDAERLDSAVAGIKETGANAFAFVGDLAEASAATSIANAALDSLGGVDGLVSNAAVAQPVTMDGLDAAEFDRHMTVNTRATLLLANAFLPMLKASQGAIVATASIASVQPMPPLGAYAVSKAALVMLVRHLALEWGPYGIRCNCISPGAVITPASAAHYDSPERREAREREIPLRRIGSPEDMASVIRFLLSPDAAYITGVNLLVDGGLGQTLMMSPSSASQG